VRTDLTLEREANEVVAWRCDQLAASGFPRPLASSVAGDSRYDLHALIELVERGCPPNLAVRILAPLGEGGAA
jgi:hypothetical protein